MGEILTCAKCGGEMLSGCLVYFSESGPNVPFWVQGQIQKNFVGNVKNPKSEQRDVVTFCCSQCGYMEAYGRPKT